MYFSRSVLLFFFFSRGRRLPRCALVTVVQMCALPIYVRGPVEYPPVGKAAAHRINAIGRARIVAQTHIGGGKADGAAQLVAMADLALDREGPRQKPGGGRNVARLQRRADAGG